MIVVAMKFTAEALIVGVKSRPIALDSKVTPALKGLACLLGISLTHSRSGFMWTGRELNLSRVKSASDILHEIAHWQIATPIRRSLPEYGMGPGPETNLNIAEEFLYPADPAWCDREETLVSLLGILWERHLGYSHLETLYDHSLVRYDGVKQEVMPLMLRESKRLNEKLKRLAQRGFITEQGVPLLRKNRGQLSAS